MIALSAAAASLAALSHLSRQTVGPAAAPAFTVVEGTVSTKRFSIQHSLTVQKIDLGGPEVDTMSQQQLSIDSTVELEVVDTYKKMAPGRPLELQRVYKSAPFHTDFTFTEPGGGKVPEAWDAETLIKGRSVVFVWVPEEKDYSKYYDEVEGLEEYLANLNEDLDLKCLLPKNADGTPRTVKEGEGWALDLQALANLFAPGGNVPLTYVKGGKTGLRTAVAAGVGGPLHPVFGGTIKGSCGAKWAKTETSDGGRLAAIELALEIETEADRTEIARRILRQDEDDDTSPVRHAGVAWKFSGSGTLRWNLDAGRFETLQISGRQDVKSDIQFTHDQETSRQMLSMAGGLTLNATFVPAKK